MRGVQGRKQNEAVTVRQNKVCGTKRGCHK